MADSLKRERTSLRSRVTRKVNSLISSMNLLPAVELTADLDMLKEFHDNLKVLDRQILEELRLDSSVTPEALEKLEDECDSYLRKLKVCMNGITVKLNSLATGTSSSSNI